MFFFKNVQRYCFYRRIYENIQIIRALQIKEKAKNNVTKRREEWWDNNVNKNDRNMCRSKNYLSGCTTRDDNMKDDNMKDGNMKDDNMKDNNMKGRNTKCDNIKDNNMKGRNTKCDNIKDNNMKGRNTKCDNIKDNNNDNNSINNNSINNNSINNNSINNNSINNNSINNNSINNNSINNNNIKDKDEKHFYKNIFSELKKVNDKCTKKYVPVDEKNIKSVTNEDHLSKKNILENEKKDAHFSFTHDEGNNKEEIKNDNIRIIPQSIPSNDVYNISKQKKGQCKNNETKEKYLKEKNKYLVRKDIYLKVKNEHINNKELLRKKEIYSKRDMNKNNKSKMKKIIKEKNEEIFIKKNDKDKISQLDIINKNKGTKNMDNRKNYLIVKNGNISSNNKMDYLLSNNNNNNNNNNKNNNKVLFNNGKKINNIEGEQKDDINNSQTHNYKNKDVSNKIIISSQNSFLPNVEKNNIFVEYETHWDNDKIKEMLELQKDTKILKNYLFKGVLYISPFDTNKCFVISKETNGLMKCKLYSVYGYISRNRALNDDVVYAYTERRTIKNENVSNMEINIEVEKDKYESRDNIEHVKNQYNEKEDNNNEKNEEIEKGKFCRVVKIVERKNVEVVGSLNYLNIKEKINNIFGKKSKFNKNKKKNENCYIELDDNNIGNNMVDDVFKYNNHDDINNNNNNNNNILHSSNIFHLLNEKNNYVYAKVQPTDSRLPCFIYDSSNNITNMLLNYIRREKLNVYVIVKFKEWEKKQINPIGNITTILGNENNFFGIIYLFLYLYKIHYYIYKITDMNYLKSQIVISDKIMNSFINRKNHMEQLLLLLNGYNKEKEYSIQEINKKIAYLKNAQKEKKMLEKYMLKSFLSNRYIITDLDIFTIDPTKAKDLDDALSIEFIKDNKEQHELKYRYKIGIHISDVSFFVTPNSYYDNLASKICNTVYMDFTVFHMLPSILSEEICSLNTKGEKLAFSIFFYVDNISNPYNITQMEYAGYEKNPHLIEIKKTLIRSKYKLNYDMVEDYIEDIYINIKEKDKDINSIEEMILINGNISLSYFIFNFDDICKKYNISEKIGGDIFRLYLLSKMLKQKTKRKNIYQKYSLLFSLNNNKKNNSEKILPLSIEPLSNKYLSKVRNIDDINNKNNMYKSFNQFLIDEGYYKLLEPMNLKNVDIEILEYKKRSHMLIEEMMILTNFLVANVISINNMLGILRIHEDTSEDIKKNLLKIIDYQTYNKINTMINIKNNNINDILSVSQKVLNENQFLCLQYNLLKYYKEAIYIPTVEGQNNTTHFGLVLNKYIHFTSPIRRYIDIVIHRILQSLIDQDNIGYYNYDMLKNICDQCNYQKKKSDEAQIHMKNYFLNKYLIYLNDIYKKVIQNHRMNGYYSVHGNNENNIDENNDKINNIDEKNDKINNIDEKNNKINNIDEKNNQLSNNYIHLEDENKKLYNPSNKNVQRTDHISLSTYKEILYMSNYMPIKKYFYLNNGIISFLTEAYIQEIIITKSIRENICINIVKENYISINENYSNEIIPYTCYICNDFPHKDIEKDYIRNDNLNNDNSLFNSQMDNNENETNVETLFKKSINENNKLKNAIVFYVPILEIEKSISDNLLSLKFHFLIISYKEKIYIYNILKGVLYEMCSNILLGRNEKNNNDIYDDDINLEDEYKKNKQLYDIFEKIKHIQLDIKYKMESVENKKDFQNVYDGLYIHDVLIEKNKNEKGEENKSNILTYKKNTTINNISNEQNYINNVGKDESEYLKCLNDKKLEYKYYNSYEKLSRFQKNKVFIIPGSQMWTLRLI
ncbi:exoribonuclease II [Plasmodium falciparum NF54]|uniref:Exoribonuclease II n=2 Tax=Plasmodium falciparum TaxID=5833 RepID=C0H520_PLAF7|nr:exoribonuclease II [Plasmodium falciparum 3D7]KAF4330588.1 exoribonuclease II [Plasmodium falciparum NF54]PKC45200.1 exoribonuclease II [Plasmodium falciparum NF54]CAX64197.1 exoribonuclease II [Plasmodium falciparum 3D7]|eukprot:XP_002808916.1 exoribonuclease II [Plasmodium falciparum 3D7]